MEKSLKDDRGACKQLRMLISELQNQTEDQQNQALLSEFAEACIFISFLSLLSISHALLPCPSVCVLCPLRWSLVSIMVPKMHCGFVGAVRRKGMYECDCVCVCVGSEKWCGHFDTWEVFHQQLEAEWTASKALTHSLFFSLSHTLTNTWKTTQTEEIHTLCMLEMESTVCIFTVFKIQQNGNNLLFYSLHFLSTSTHLMEC